ncbi:hypothetical protein [Xanthomonas phage X1]|nr:hypothetical protein [Xanthomonas phage X1]
MNSIHHSEYTALRNKSANYEKAHDIKAKYYNAETRSWDNAEMQGEYEAAWGLWLKEVEAVVGPLDEGTWIALEEEQMRHEFDDDGNHRLVKGNKSTQWAHYTQICFLDGVVGHTAYYGVKENMLSPEEFVRLIATT